LTQAKEKILAQLQGSGFQEYGQKAEKGPDNQSGLSNFPAQAVQTQATGTRGPEQENQDRAQGVGRVSDEQYKFLEKSNLHQHVTGAQTGKVRKPQTCFVG